MAKSDDFAYGWDESKRRNTCKSRVIDFADMVLFDWDTALTRADIAGITARLCCPIFAVLEIVFMVAYRVGVETL